ncbi:MAG: helix-hairpin-helix domain-containing protein [Lachnospiraceae bacterium]|nr:helix-hairpin-helix domain-containing protein [Lachnospiraceae bacterium]
MINKKMMFCILLLSTQLLYLGGCADQESAVYFESASQNEGESVIEDSVGEPTSCYVYICGEVVSPGVYELPEGARICDVMEAAGGLTQEAAVEGINQAQKVSDGEMIRIPNAQEAAERQSAQQQDPRLDINTATEEQLKNLPGIGQAKAESIVAYREEHGAFTKIEELMNISGIKEGVFDKIKDSIRVD